MYKQIVKCPYCLTDTVINFESYNVNSVMDERNMGKEIQHIVEVEEYKCKNCGKEYNTKDSIWGYPIGAYNYHELEKEKLFKYNKAKIIFVGNYKGGVGKTTSVLNFATYFAKYYNKKVLTIDLDPQSSLSEILVSNNECNTSLSCIPDKKTLNYIFDLSITKIKKYNSINLEFDDDIIQYYSKGKFYFIPSSLYYSNGGLDDLVIRMEDNLEYLSILKNYIDRVSGNYDYIIIDAPPSNNLITRSMFLMSDYYIIPTILDKISANGVAHYIKTIEKTYKYYCEDLEDRLLAKHYFGDKPKLLGIFFTLIRGQVNYDEEVNSLKKLLINNYKIKEDDIIYYKINNYIDIARSSSEGKETEQHKDYKELSKHLIDLIVNNIK